MNKKIISLALASTLLMGTVAFAGGTKDIEISKDHVEKKLISENPDNTALPKKAEQSNYLSYSGKIMSVDTEGGVVSIVVDERQVLKEGSQKASVGAVKFNISTDTVVLSDETQDFITADKLVEGAVVEVSYGKNSPMTKSLPPMTNADVVVLRESQGSNRQLGVKVDKFDSNHTSVDNFLKYNVTDETVIVDQKGNRVKKEELANKHLVVFYGPAVTMSIPAQAPAQKIIVLNKGNTSVTPEANKEIKVLDKIVYNGKEIKLKHHLSKSGDVFMMPIREVGEALGYKISWQAVSRQVELTKGAHYLTATANQDMYSKAKMIVKLGTASNLTNGTTYVPVDFITKVMQLDMEVTADGTINIK